MSKDQNRPDSCNIASALIHQAEQQGQNIAIHYPVGKRGKHIAYASVTYSALNQLSDEYARGLIEYGIGRGVRSALMLTPGLDFFAMFFALFKAGAVPVLIDPGIGIKPLKTCLADALPQAFIGVTKAHIARALLGWVPGEAGHLRSKTGLGRTEHQAVAKAGTEIFRQRAGEYPGRRNGSLVIHLRQHRHSKRRGLSAPAFHQPGRNVASSF